MPQRICIKTFKDFKRQKFKIQAVPIISKNRIAKAGNNNKKIIFKNQFVRRNGVRESLCVNSII